MGCGASSRTGLLIKIQNHKKIKDKNLFLEAFGTEFKEVKGLVINENTEFVTKKPISENNPCFQEELLIYGDESDTVRPWVSHIIQPNSILEEKKGHPNIKLKPIHIFGYRCVDARGNLFFLDDNTIIYHSGIFGIVHNIKTNRQKIFGGTCKTNIKADSSNNPNDYNDPNKNLNQKNISVKVSSNSLNSNKNNNLISQQTQNVSHTKDIVAIAIYKGSVSMVATGQIDSRPYILIWSPQDPSVIYGKLIQDLGSKSVGNIAFDNQGVYLASLGRDEMNSFYIFDIQSKEIVWKDITGSDILFDVKFSPVDNNEICIIGVNSVIFANLKTKEKINHARNIKKYKNMIFTCLSYNKDGQKVITSTSTGVLVIWTTNKENTIMKDIIEIKVSNFSILNLKISSYSSKIYCTDSNKKIFVFDSDSNKIENTIDVDADVKGIDVNSKEKLVLGLADGKILVKNMKSGRLREITYSHNAGKLRGLEYIAPNYVEYFII